MRANTIAPTAVATDLNRDLMASQAELYRPLIEGTPLGRLCEATDLVGLMVLLASPAGSFISGQTFFVDGGFTVC
ncbi:MAG: SDR family oxidoreductase [Pigmentiphaga sp.]